MLFGLVVGVLLSCSGCVEDRYQVEMELLPDAVNRTVTVKQHALKDRVEEREVERKALAAVYSKVELDAALKASGKFSGPLPDDIGTFARVTRFESEFGELVIYLERIRGTDDWVAIRQRELEAADALTDMVVAWARATFAGKPAAGELIEFLDGPARRDLQNLGYLTSMFMRTEEGNRSQRPEQKPPFPHMSDLTARALAYLTSRKYMSLDDPNLWGVVHTTESNTKLTSVLVLNMLRSRLTTDGKGDAAALLIPAEDLALSFMAFTHDHPEVLRGWYERHNEELPNEDPEERDYEISAAFERLIFPAAGVWTNSRDDVLLTLQHGGQVLASNGNVADEDRLEWNYHIARERTDTRFPTATPFAVLVRPSPERQTALLGHLIPGEELARYCITLATLTPEQRSRWNALVTEHGKDMAALERHAEPLGLPWQTASQLIDALRTPTAP